MVIGEKELSGAPLRVEGRDGKVISLMEFSSLI
jgi:hypothetical protein